MGTKTFTVEQIISKLREAEIALSRGQTVAEHSALLTLDNLSCAHLKSESSTPLKIR